MPIHRHMREALNPGQCRPRALQMRVAVRCAHSEGSFTFRTKSHHIIHRDTAWIAASSHGRPAVKRLVKILDGTLVTNTSYDNLHACVPSVTDGVERNFAKQTMRTHVCANCFVIVFARATSSRACRHIGRRAFMVRLACIASTLLQRLDPHLHCVLPRSRRHGLGVRVGLPVHLRIIWLGSDVVHLCQSFCRSRVHRRGLQTTRTGWRHKPLEI